MHCQMNMDLLIHLVLSASLFLITTKAQEDSSPSPRSLQRILDILERTPIIDGHNDFPLALRKLFQNNLTYFNFDTNLTATKEFQGYPEDQTDLPRMRKGRVGGQFWSAYVGCEAQYKNDVQLYMEQIDVIHRFIQKYPSDLKLVTTASGIEEAMASGKIASLIGVESGQAIGSSIALVRILYSLGARYLTLTHNCDTPWAESYTAEITGIPRQNGKMTIGGLARYGENVVKEMNRLGMIVDLSHSSRETMLDVLRISKAPVIFSNSAARALCSHPRNVPDDVLRLTAKNGGIVMINFYSCFLVSGCNATVQDVVDHINYIRNVTSVNNVAIGSNFNGNDRPAKGLEDASKFPNLFSTLLEDSTFKWTDEDLGKLASGNLIRVMKATENVSTLLKNEKPIPNFYPRDEFGNNTFCITHVGKDPKK